MRSNSFVYYILLFIAMFSCSKNETTIEVNEDLGSTAEERRWKETRGFNNGTLGEKVNLSAQGNSVYDNEHVFEGSMSCKMTIEEGETGFGYWGGYIPHPEKLLEGDELWFRIRILFPEGFDYYSYGEGNRLKFLRVHSETSDGENIGYNDVYVDMKGSDNPFKYIYEGRQQWVNIGTPEHLPKFNEWETYEFYIRFHSKSKDEGGEGIVRFWKNGELLQEITHLKTLKFDTAKVGRSLIFTYWNGGAPKTQSLWVDDVVLTSDIPNKKDAKGNSFIGM
ncbi:hypothetical protein [Tenacibaculum sp. M341]|uniref:hypothetical protein n=1 Tax=Tenacibaculum sp. M341 TaxID=2530339 RepID=UPI00104F7455|nr:hypothetical protein [Tenacibaculum sp. M341]TCI85145.1 hypothetical protein EYW44_17700 [Tenacibaculum sp. M341]